jgi:hypothetical protein
MEIDRRTILKWGVGGAAAGFCALSGLPNLATAGGHLQGDAEDDIRHLIVYRWGGWNEHTIGWIQCRFQDLKKLDVSVVFDCDYHSDEEFSTHGRLLRGLRVNSDARKVTIEGRDIWMVSADAEVPPEEAKQWADINRLVFCGDGRGGYQGCAGTQRATRGPIPKRMCRGPYDPSVFERS